MEKTKWILILVALLVVPMRGQTPQKISDINKNVVGKWWSSDRISYIEFLPNGACSEGVFYDGTWRIEQGKLSAWDRGKEFYCVSGALTLIRPNTLIRDNGMGGAPTRYYRGLQPPKPAPGPATCTLCGVWKAVVGGRRINRSAFDKTGNPFCGCDYLKITKVGDGKFKLTTGSENEGKVIWTEPFIKNADSIYPKPISGKLAGTFVSLNFYATRGQDFTFRITCELNPDNELLFSVSANGKTERARYSRIQ